MEPFRMGLSDKKAEINFGGYDVNDSGKGKRYEKGGFLNFQLDTELVVQSAKQGVLTLKDVMGNFVDLAPWARYPLGSTKMSMCSISV